ncbi:MAG: DUF2341 domain-containing protein, partial [Deltaproteobacteria bacterium]|nr:DUF2341 domain-containing protein [Deltaproteobacteria bacterium]
GSDVKAECVNEAFCDGLETCDGDGACAVASNPCGDLACDEEGDFCYGCESHAECPACQYCDVDERCMPQAPGRDDKDDCEVAVCATGNCDGVGACEYRGVETKCRDAEDPECGVEERCDSTGPLCPPNSHIPLNAPCTADEHDCSDDICDGEGLCTHPAKAASTICRLSVDIVCNPEEACNGFDLDCPDDDVALSTVACDSDGSDCTADFCDGAGACAHVPDHSACIAPAVCMPACSVDLSGCAVPPTSMSLSCVPDVLDLQAATSSDCVLEAGLSGQEACLSCSAELGTTLLAYADFGDDTGGCDLDGWQLAEGLPATNCKDALQDCVEAGAEEDCCDELSAICVQLDGNYVLQSDKISNCGSKKEEWRLARDFDFRGYEQIQVCADVGHNNMDDKQAIAFYAENLDSTGSGEVARFMCANRDEGVPFPLAVDLMESRCAMLDAWANESSKVRLTVVAHSENDNRRIYLDNLSVRALPVGCSPITDRPFFSNFDACETEGISVIPNGWRGWTVDSGDLEAFPKCPGSACSNNSSGATVEVDDNTMRLERVVDTRGLDGEVRLCFTFADDGAGEGSSLRASFHSGMAWRQAYYQADDLGTNQECRELCINLSDLDPAVARNPALGIRFDVTAVGGKIYFQDIHLEGIVACDAGTDVFLTSLVEGNGGHYSFTARDDATAPFDADLVCAWGDPAGSPHILAFDTVAFRNPLPDWTRRRPIYFDNQTRAEALRDFPVPLRLDASRVDYSLTDGRDLRFLDAQLNPLAFEIEIWDENGVSVVWVRVPEIGASSDASFIWMYYGNPSAEDGQDPDGVWDRHFLGVYHLAETVGTEAFESSAYDFEGSYLNDTVLGGLGMFADGAAQFDGTDDRVNLGGIDVPPAKGDDGITLEFVGRLDDDTSEDTGRLISKADGDADAEHWWMLSTRNHDNGNYALRFRLKLNGTTQVRISTQRPIAENQWFYAVGTYDGSQMRMFVDGQSLAFSGDASMTGAVSQDASKSAAIGGNPDNSNYFKGMVGEVRISNVARSAAWIGAQLQAMLDLQNSPFAIFGAVEFF